MNKVERQLSLLSLLLHSPHGRTRSEIFEYLKEQYKGNNPESIRRQFERDKNSLKNLGYAIETIINPHDENLYSYKLNLPDSLLDTSSLDYEEEQIIHKILSMFIKVKQIPYYNKRLFLKLYNRLFGSEELEDFLEEQDIPLSDLFNPFLDRQGNTRVSEEESDLYSFAAAAIEQKFQICFLYSPIAKSVLYKLLKIDSGSKITKKQIGQVENKFPFPIHKRIIQPYGIFINGQRFCLIAKQISPKEGIRTYYLDKVLNAEKNTPPNSYTIPADFRLKDYRPHPLFLQFHKKIPFVLKILNNEYDSIEGKIKLFFSPLEGKITKRNEYFEIKGESSNLNAIYTWLWKNKISNFNLIGEEAKKHFKEYLKSIEKNLSLNTLMQN